MKTKRVISHLIILLVLATIVYCPCVSADQSYTLAYSVNSDGETATVTGFEGQAPSTEYDLVIPRTVNIGGKIYRVTDVGNNAFSNDKANAMMKSLSLPATLETIGDSAFARNTGLKTLRFPSGLKSIGQTAFLNCSGLLEFGNLPENVKIGVRAFDSCGGLQNRRDEGQSTYISGSANLSNGAFKAARLWRVIFGEGLTALPAETFYDIPTVRIYAFPSTCTEFKNFSMGSRGGNNITNFYALSDNVKIAADTFDPKLIGSESKTYNITVMNDDVKQAFVNAGFNENSVNVAKAPVTIVVESQDKYTVYSDDMITLPLPTLDGYIFKGYTDGIQIYNAGDVFDAKAVFDEGKGRVVSALWERDYENLDVLYKSVAGDETFEPSAVGRVIAPALAGDESEITFTDESGATESIIAQFDENGVWINTGNDDKYVSAQVAKAGDNSDVSLLLPCETDSIDYVMTKLREPQKIIYARIDGEFDSENIEWGTNNPAVATVDENGYITGRKSGTAVITAQCGSVSYSINLEVKGEIADAVEKGTVAQYIAEKKPIIDSINLAIKNKDKDTLVEILSGTGEISIKDINDFDYSFVEAIKDNPTLMNEFSQRLFTYPEFKWESVDDAYNFIDVLINEIKAGELNHLNSADDVLRVFAENSNYYGIDLKHKYNVEYAAEVAKRFVGYTAKNVSAIVYDYKNAYVMEALNDAAGYTVVQTIIETCENEIGYNKKHFDSNACADMYQQIISNRASLTNIELIKNYIDEYTKKSDNDSSSSSGGGGKGSSGSSGRTYGYDKTIVDNNSSFNAPEKVTLYGEITADRWSYDAIQYLSAKGIISGYDDGSFMPHNSVSRAEFIKLMTTAFGLYTDTDADIENPFSDVDKSDWFCPYVLAAYSNGIVTGNDEKFNPNDAIMREEIAAIIYRTSIKLNVKLNYIYQNRISDMDAVSDWAQDAVEKLVSSGIISGYEDGSFSPRLPATREEAASLVYKYMKIALDEEK